MACSTAVMFAMLACMWHVDGCAHVTLLHAMLLGYKSVDVGAQWKTVSACHVCLSLPAMLPS